MISHFGKNPVNGGRPARESRVRNSIVLSGGFFVHVVIKVDSFRTLLVFRARKMVIVIRI